VREAIRSGDNTSEWDSAFHEAGHAMAYHVLHGGWPYRCYIFTGGGGRTEYYGNPTGWIAEVITAAGGVAGAMAVGCPDGSTFIDGTDLESLLTSCEGLGMRVERDEIYDQDEDVEAWIEHRCREAERLLAARWKDVRRIAAAVYEGSLDDHGFYALMGDR
jgi:hypothetical protein